MRRRVTEKELVQRVVNLAAHIRYEIEKKGLDITDFAEIAHYYEVEFEKGELPNGEDGSYLKDKRKIILNARIMHPERENFNFCHELIHDRIEHDDELLSLFADAYINPDREYETMERLCNAGAGELLIPSQNVCQMMFEKGFSTARIPDLCDQFKASSIAVAFQMVNYASHNCYLVIAEPQYIGVQATNEHLKLFNLPSIETPQERLVIIHTGASSTAKYSIRRYQALPLNHSLYDTLTSNEPKYGKAKIPFATGNGWDVSCDSLFYRGKVFAFFNVDLPISNLQARLF